VTTAINGLQASINKQQQDRSGQGDQLSGQIQALNDTMDELKVRLTKLSNNLEDMQVAQQSMAAQQSQRSMQAQAIAQAPAPDVLLQQRPARYNGAKKISPSRNSTTTSSSIEHDLAGNAYFYLAEIQFKAATTRKQSRTTISFCRIFPAEIRRAAAQLKEGIRHSSSSEKKTKHTGIEARHPELSAHKRSDRPVNRLRKLAPVCQRLAVALWRVRRPARHPTEREKSAHPPPDLRPCSVFDHHSPQSSGYQSARQV